MMFYLLLKNLVAEFVTLPKCKDSRMQWPIAVLATWAFLARYSPGLIQLQDVDLIDV